MKGVNNKKLSKKHNHDHYWIEEEVLYESYRTVRGLRFMPVLNVPGMVDEDNCSEECIEYINNKYFDN